MSKKFIFTLVSGFIMFALAALAVLYAKGYTFSPGEQRLVGTGILAVTSVPSGASVYIDGHLTTATDNTINQLSPQIYKIKIAKEGFAPWEKNVEIKEGLVTEIKASLFPSLPTIYPFTHNGISSAALSPDGQKLAYAVPYLEESSTIKQRGGVYIWTMVSQPISFTRNAGQRQIVSSTTTLDFSKAVMRWSPDSKQLLVTLQENEQPGQAFERNYLLSPDQSTSVADLRDITPILAATISSWEEDQKLKDDARLALIQNTEIKGVASDSGIIRWSPDETKIMVGPDPETLNPQPTKKAVVKPVAKEGAISDSQILSGYKVFDLETGKNYDLPPAKSYQWLPDSLHVVLVEENEVSIIEFDGNNKTAIFPGNFAGNGVFPWPDSSRLILHTTFPSPTTQPNLFGINLK